jgi:hypothetical protein
MAKRYDELTGLMIDDSPRSASYLVAHVVNHELKWALAEFPTAAQAMRYQLREGVRAFTEIVKLWS